MTFLMSKFLIVLGGPTASGKTTVGITLANRFNAEIISADSRQIYRETLIGTAVPNSEELASIPHHFIQSLSLNDYYNASMYEVDVLNKLDTLFQKNDIALMVGGSGMYINAVCFGIDNLPTIDQDIRQELAIKFEKEGIESLRNDLQKLDPVTYDKVDLNNHYRILKALEVSVQTGKPYSSFLKHKKQDRDFHLIRIGLDMDRKVLYDRINTRVDKMIEAGLVEEVEGLVKFKGKSAMKTVGYREIFKYLDKEISLEEAVDLIKRNTRKYARKQLTWFRKDKLFPWFHPSEIDRMVGYVESEMKISGQ
jgi:tRNA dimethylallyltransferase